MTRMWVVEGTEGYWKAYGWEELRRELRQGVSQVLLEHEETIDAERALEGR